MLKYNRFMKDYCSSQKEHRFQNKCAHTSKGGCYEYETTQNPNRTRGSASRQSTQIGFVFFGLLNVRMQTGNRKQKSVEPTQTCQDITHKDEKPYDTGRKN